MQNFNYYTSENEKISCDIISKVTAYDSLPIERAEVVLSPKYGKLNFIKKEIITVEYKPNKGIIGRDTFNIIIPPDLDMLKIDVNI